MQLRRNTPKRDRNERGIVAAIFVLIIAVILGVASILYYLHVHSVVSRELESGADAAAQSGSVALDSTREGYRKAKAAAIDVLSRSSALGGTGSNNLGSALDPNLGPIWDLSATHNLIVAIERGFWSDDSQSFMSFDSENWERDFPGVPSFVAANAVRVSLQRPRTKIDTFIYGKAAAREEATTIAVSGTVGSACIAPFAIPVCALLNERGDFDAESACRGDRIFTQSDRYCPGDDSSCVNDLPSLPFGTGSRVLSNDQGVLLGVSFNHGSSNPGIGTGWSSQQDFPNPQDHYGVIGFPERQSDPTGVSARLNAIFASAGNCFSANIGDSFYIYGPGFPPLPNPSPPQNYRTRLANRIVSDPNLTPPPNDPELRYVLGIPNQQRIVIDFSNGDAALSFPDGSGRGACNSRWINYSQSWIPGMYYNNSLSLAGNLRVNINGTNYPNFGQQPFVDLPALRLWQAKVPVIADFSPTTARACQNRELDPTSLDGGVDASEDSDWRIIGFVDASIYDMDIGQPPPQFAFAGTPLPQLSFKQPCNMVRARIDCKSKFIPTEDGRLTRTPRIVSR